MTVRREPEVEGEPTEVALAVSQALDGLGHAQLEQIAVQRQTNLRVEHVREMGRRHTHRARDIA